MNWEKVREAGSPETYRLVEKSQVLLTLTLHPRAGATRVECNREQRVFLIRQEGFLKNKTVLRNEYGVKMGELGQENRQRFIELNGEKLFYTVRNNPVAELVLYRETADSPFLTCGLDTRQQTPGIRFTGEENTAGLPHPGLLMGLCWYLFLPVAKENVADFAS